MESGNIHLICAFISGAFAIVAAWLPHHLKVQHDRKIALAQTASKPLEIPSTPEISRPKFVVLTKRNALAAVLLAGIAAGIYLGDLWKGLDRGSFSNNQSNTVVTAYSIPKPDVEPTAKIVPHEVLRILIADQSYFLRSPQGDQPIELKKLIEMAKAATGDADGVRVRIYRRISSRTSAEIALRDALLAGGVSEDVSVWISRPIED